MADRTRLTWKAAASLSIGDRTLPLEMDPKASIVRKHSLIGKTVEVSSVAGGDLLPLRGKNGKVTGVFLRLGEVVGFELEVGQKALFGTIKDVLIDRAVLEDIQPPTAMSALIRSALAHWSEQRTYWHTQIDGMEALCFELASVTDRAAIECFPWGWRFLVPGNMGGDSTVVDCRAMVQGNFWSLGVLVYSERRDAPEVEAIPDHWSRVFSWAHYIAVRMTGHGFPWNGGAMGLEVRERASIEILRPLVASSMEKALAARERVLGPSEIPISPLSSAFSTVRLKPATIGLTEPPTDLRAYTVLSISPGTLSPDAKENYLETVVLHECAHIAVASIGGDPHGEDFSRVAAALGLPEEDRH